MSDMKKLIEAVDKFAGQAVGQKPGDQVRGTDKATPKKSGKHPFAGRLVGASESKSLLADLEKELVEGAVKRGLAEEFASFKESRVAYDKKTGQMGVDNEDPDQRHGLYINGKLVKTVNGADAANNLKKRDPRFKDATVKKIAESSLNEFATGKGGGESGRWYTDDQITDIVGDGWWQDLDLSGASIGTIDSDVPKEHLIGEAQAWLDDQGYNVQVLNVNVNDDDCDWYIEGDFGNPNFASKGMHEGVLVYPALPPIVKEIANLHDKITALPKRHAVHRDARLDALITLADLVGGSKNISRALTLTDIIKQMHNAGTPGSDVAINALKELTSLQASGTSSTLRDKLDQYHTEFQRLSDICRSSHYSERELSRSPEYKQAAAIRQKIKQMDNDLMQSIALFNRKESIAEGLTPAGQFLSKAERVKAGDLVYYKGKCVGTATGKVKNHQIEFKVAPGEISPDMSGLALLPIDDISLREGKTKFSDLERAIMEGGNSLEELNPADAVTLDIPLFIRLLEYAREDAKTDMDLHNVAENAIKLSAGGNVLSMDNYESIIPSDAVDEDVDSFGYKRLHPEIFKARQQFPHAKSDMEALLMHVQSQGEKDIDRVDRVNDREDAEIDQLNREEDSLEAQVDALYAQLDKLKAQTKTVKEEVPAPVATAGGPAGANQPKTPPGVTPKVDPAQQALLKQNQSKLQQNLANLKSAGVQIDPAKAAQSLQKTDTGAPMNAMDKDNIAAMAPAIGNVMANPSTASQLNTLIKKAGGGA